MGGSGSGRPKKPPNETYRGKRAAKKIIRDERIAENLKKKTETRQLWEKGLCKAPDGMVRTFQEVGRSSGHLGGPYGGRPTGSLGGPSGSLGGPAGAKCYEQASNVDKQLWSAQASIGGSAAWGNLSNEKRTAIIDAGTAGGRKAAKEASEQEKDACREAGRVGGTFAWYTADEAQLKRIAEGSQKAAQIRTARAEVGYAGSGPPPRFVANSSVWDCKGTIGDNPDQPCRLACVDNITALSFVGATDLSMLKWLINHHLLEPDCNREGCGGDCRAVALNKDKEIGLKCNKCSCVSVGGFRGFWSKGKIGVTTMVLLVYAAVTGMSLVALRHIFGHDVCSKNTWTRYIKDVGLVCAEALERDRRDPANQYSNCQSDESAMGDRKYKRGKRVRKMGVQWALSCVDVDPNTGRTIAVDIQFLPYNKRDTESILPLLVQRLKPGGTLTTDCWRAYPACARAAGVTHLTVNHSKHFADPETGVHTNNVEGIHGVIKKYARAQFGRLPNLSSSGFTNYLDLLVWKTNVKMAKVPEFSQWCRALWMWTKHPLEDFDHIIPVWQEDDDVDNDSQDADIDGHAGDDDDDDGWFLAADDVESDGDGALDVNAN